METGSVNDLKTFVGVKSFGDILPKNGTNIRSPYEHQKKAMEALDKINKEESYSTLVVLPTGGGKTYTASMWLLKNAIDKKKKILWIAHRQMLLDQAAESLPSLFKSFDVTEEYLTKEQLDEMEAQCRDSFFCGEMIPPYESRDVINIIKYYAQYEEAPRFYTFEEVDRNKLDISKIARHIWDEDMGVRKKAEYIDELWNSGDDNMLRLFFGRKIYFSKQLDIELMKLADPDIGGGKEGPIVNVGLKNLEDLPLHIIRKINPDHEKYLRDETFKKYTDEAGNYRCACCGFTDRSRVPFQVDHIIAMNNGGKSVVENLQILCRSCNARKSDK